MPRRQPDDRIVVGGDLGMILDQADDRREAVVMLINGGGDDGGFSLCYHSYLTTTYMGPKKLSLRNFKTRTREQGWRIGTVTVGLQQAS